MVRAPKAPPPAAGCCPKKLPGAAADVLVEAPNRLPKPLAEEAAADEEAGMLKLKVFAAPAVAALEAPKSDGVVCGVPNAGVLGVPNGDGLADAPKAGVELAPNSEGVLLAGAPNAGVLGAPNAGVLDAPKGLGLDAA